MKTELKAKFLQHLTQKKQDEGFTVIELLVVLIIMGILSAIALPSFLNQASKGKQAEAKQYTGALNRSQQAHYVQEGQFGSSVTALGVGIRTETINYKYEIDGTYTGTAAVVTNKGTSKLSGLKSYAGVVGLLTVSTDDDPITQTVLCEANNIGLNTPDTVTGGTTCPNNFSLIK